MNLLKQIWSDITNAVSFAWQVFTDTIYAIFHDSGVLVIFVVAGLAYPLLYNALYYNNALTEVPIAVVDHSGSPASTRFLRKLDASHDVKIEYRCTSMLEAERLLRSQKVHGIIYFPTDYEACIETARDVAHISLYLDMTSFLYMKAVFMAANMIMLEEMHDIQIDRYVRMGIGDEIAWSLVQELQYDEVKLYNETDGYGTFLIPAVLVLILHQTLLFGTCMLLGTYYEEKRRVFTGNAHHWSHAVLICIGMSLAFTTIYIGLSAIDLVLIPRIFSLPHLGSMIEIMKFTIPFLLATSFFSIFVAGFMHNRETGMVVLLSSSLIFLFISGVSWPQASIPKAWLYLSYLFPSTWGIHGYIHINSMGATIEGTAREYYSLWALAIFYFLAATIQMYLFIKPANRKHVYKNPRLERYLNKK
ncbi:MAG: ABC transporter permease [Paludibacteraceae bacterium]|nr:ABC transporter permease [Paludibacteraceae bacterium]